ncbi:hypothetical protein [Tenacibaculum larymnensis]|uniref:Knr4/Smi1-like domain-containing protein n=1 Tax=Tenacibaculum larymnensis TaxID=2878201 RepID=A0A9X4ELJ1_9FLAO|nr:hypothetical protein [Tenacibaculum larymnensis]MDE1206207.1 hypothetical protein [Tenacibaculum larymnensis]
MINLIDKIKTLEKTFIKNAIIFNIKKREPLGEKKVIALSKEYNLPDELVQFYLAYNGLFITWFSDLDILCTGRMFIPDLESLKKYFINTSKTDLKSFSIFIKKGYIPLDVDAINGYVTFIKVEENAYTLIRVDIYHSEIELGISIIKYLEIGIMSGGLYHWQNYISENTYNHFKKYSYDGFVEIIADKLEVKSLDYFHTKFINRDFTFSKIKSIKLNLPENSQIKKRKENFGCSNVEVRKAEMSIQNKLPSSFVNWAYNINGLEINWNFDSSFANFKVIGIEKIFGGVNHGELKKWKNSYATYLGLDDSHEKKYGSFYPFIFEESGHTVFKIENDEVLLYFIKDLEPIKINLTFNQFINKLYECGGISGWQNLFINQYSKENPEIKSLLKNIKICFPDIDIKKFIGSM